MAATRNQATNTIKIKQIFADHWNKVVNTSMHKVPTELHDSVIEAVEKMLRCGDPRYGFAKYICFDCGQHEKVIGFSCKSGFAIAAAKDI